MTAQAWGEAERREAKARQHELAAKLILAGEPDRAHWTGIVSDDETETEERWRTELREEAGFSPARIDAEVRRVRALAQGRLVRSTTMEKRIRCDACDDTGCVYDEPIPVTCGKCLGKATVTVRVTRIRRAA
jgi:ribosomal protein S27E